METFFDFGEIIKKDTEFVIFGIPWDSLTSIKGVESSKAPKRIREATYDIGLATELGIEIPKLKVCDKGDIEIDSKDISENLKNIEDFIQKLYETNSSIIPVMIGGDHFCSYPVIRKVGNFLKEDKLGVLVFDAHLDFYDKWEENKYSHATISHRIFDLDFINNQNFLIVGTRDIDIPEQNLAKQNNLEFFNAYEFHNNINEFSQRIINFFHNSKVEKLYISIDIDVLDPSIAPGTGYAIPGGFSYRELWHILRKLSIFFDIIGFDLVEVAPNLDLLNKITCNTAAKIIIELISFI
ncbi:MAG: agmatinase [Promethearchaeota archaeon]|nr:MAG: agmatinase [Candidatus Lokiarchaeota archaeon]